MFKFKFVLAVAFLTLITGCVKKENIIGEYKIEKFNPEKIDDMYTNISIKDDNTFELTNENKDKVISGKWNTQFHSIIFDYGNIEVKGELKDYGAFIVNSPNDFHGGHFSIILYVKVNNN